MKKLIMFLMVIAIGVPAPADIEDVSPPVWGGTTPSTNVVWQIDTEYGVPSCTAYDPSDDDPEYYFGSHEGGPTGTWDSEAGTFTLQDGDFLHVLVEVPGGVGDNLTIRVQTAIEGDPDFAETNLEIWASGKEDFAGEMATNAVEDPPGSGVWVQEGTFTPTTGGVKSWFSDAGNIIGILNGGPFTMTGMIIDVIRHDGDAPTSGPGRDICGGGGPENPFAIDPNVMLVYETGETEGNFTVALKKPPVGQGSPGNPGGTPISVEIIVDPNGYLTQAGELRGGGGNPDIILLGSSDPCDNRITFTKTAANWDVPEVIRFKAIDDEAAEPPILKEAQSIAVWAVPSPYEPNLARPIAQKIVSPEVMDNDQANILFTVTPWGATTPKNPVIGPVQLWEERGGTWYVIRKRNIGVTVQVPPLVGGDPCQPSSVKLQAVIEGEIAGDNFPLTTPTLPYQESGDPNGMIFTAANYNVSQPIKIWGNDDDVLQAEGAEADGDENYQATLVVTVIDDGGDSRYTDLERIVTLDIEDNECGAYGISYLDIGNPNAATDPNYRDEDGNPLPDCYVDLYDVIEFATQWLDCSDPQDPACDSYL